MRPSVLLCCFVLFLAPACAPDAPSAPPEAPRRNAVILTDTTRRSATALNHLRDSLRARNYRVLVSGYPGETAAELNARLPWLLQPGVHLIVYDSLLAGPGAVESVAGVEVVDW